MAEVPVKKTTKKQTRKTTTKKVGRNSVAATVSKSESATTVKAKRKGPSLKFVLLTILFLFLASGGAFYIGYSAEGAIDVNQRLSDDATRTDGQVTGGDSGVQKPAPLKERPKLEPAAVETPAPAPAAEEAETSKDGESEANDDAEVVDVESSAEAGTEEAAVVSDIDEPSPEDSIE